jgi:hypothetical protein
MPRKILILRCAVEDVAETLLALGETDAVPGLDPRMFDAVPRPPKVTPFGFPPAPIPSTPPPPVDVPSDEDAKRFTCHYAHELGQPTACGLHTSKDGHAQQVMCSTNPQHVECDECKRKLKQYPPVVHALKSRVGTAYCGQMPEHQPSWVGFTGLFGGSDVTCPACLILATGPKGIDAIHVCMKAGSALCGMTPDAAHTAVDLSKATCVECMAKAAKLTAPPADPFVASAAKEARLAEGQAKFDNLVGIWIQNFETDSDVQPDRYERLVSTFAGFGAGAVWAYLEHKGGLAQAILDALVRNSWASQDAKAVPRIVLAKKIALNMVQVGSTSGFPLRDYTEACVIHAQGRTNEKGERVPDETPISGPMCKAGVEQERSA